MNPSIACLMLALLNGAGADQGQAVTHAARLSGIFLTSEAHDAMSVPVKFVFKDPEPQRYSIRPKPYVRFSHMRFARAGGLFQPGGHVGLARNRYEKNNRGYHAHIYLTSQASQHLSQAMAEQKADAVLVIEGLGKGRVKPVDLRRGHWAVANMRSDGPGGYLTVTLNTHIIIAWQESGQTPKPAHSDRQEVEYSLSEYLYQYFFQMGGCGVGGAMRSEDFARTGQIGAAIYARFVDSDDAKAALKHQGPNQSFATMAKSFGGNLPPAMQGAVFKRVKQTTFRRALVCDTRFVFWALNQSPDAEAYQKRLLTEDDSLIVAAGFAVAPAKAVQTYRARIIESLNACFAKKQMPRFTYSRLFDKIADETLTECAPALAQYLAQTDDARIVEQGIKTLGQLAAYDLLGDLALSRPALDEKQLRRIFRYFHWKGLDDQHSTQKAAALVALSEAALEGTWTEDIGSRRHLVAAVLSHVSPRGKSGLSEERTGRESYQHMRNALHNWIDEPGGEEVLGTLAAWAPQPSETPLFVEGLQKPDLETSAHCIAALSKLNAEDAMPALLAVFDRTDALSDLHAQYRDSSEMAMSAMSVPPADRDNLAYKADEALFDLAGGRKAGLEPVPPFTGKQVLDQRRTYWRAWVESR